YHACTTKSHLRSVTRVCVYTSYVHSDDTPNTVIFTLSLHDALPISLDPLAAGEDLRTLGHGIVDEGGHLVQCVLIDQRTKVSSLDRKSTRLNSSHVSISYAVFCLKKKNYIIYILTVDHID